MKNNPIVVFLLGLCLLSAFAEVLFIGMYQIHIHQLENLSKPFADAKGAEQLITAIYKDTLEYSHATRNPADINRILQSLTLFNQNPPAAAPAKPAAR